MNSRFRSKPQWHNSVPLGCHVGAPQRDSNKASPYIFTNLDRSVLQIARIWKMASTPILAWVFPYLPPFIYKILGLVYRTVLILIFDGVTPWKTSNSDLRFFTILDIICYTVPFFRNFQLIQSLRPYLSTTISNCMCNEHEFIMLMEFDWAS